MVRTRRVHVNWTSPAIEFRPRARGRSAPVLRWASHHAARRAVLPHLSPPCARALRARAPMGVAPRGATRGAPQLLGWVGDVDERCGAYGDRRRGCEMPLQVE